MAFLFDVNNAAITGPAAMFKLKTLLVSAGWVVRSSGDGSGAGAGAYSSTGDVITSGGTGAGGLGNTSAWYVIEMPLANGVNRQIMIQRSSDTAWIMKYSYSAKFTGGSPGATVPGTATDSQNFINGSTLFAGNNTYRWNAAADNAAPYGFWSATFPIGGGSPNACFFMVPLQQADSLDVDPYLFYTPFGSSVLRLADITSGGNGLWAWFRKGLTNERWNSPFTSGGQVRCLSFIAGAATCIPGGVGANPHNGLDDTFPIPVASDALSNGISAFWPGGFKGMSVTMMRWGGTTHTTGDTVSVASAGAKDWIQYGDVLFPWNGSTPTV